MAWCSQDIGNTFRVGCLSGTEVLEAPLMAQKVNPHLLVKKYGLPVETCGNMWKYVDF